MPRQKRSFPPPSLTHFPCIPLAASASRPKLMETIAEFREDVMGPSVRGDIDLHSEAVRSVGTLHLTLGFLSLREDKKRHKTLRF